MGVGLYLRGRCKGAEPPAPKALLTRGEHRFAFAFGERATRSMWRYGTCTPLVSWYSTAARCASTPSIGVSERLRRTTCAERRVPGVGSAGER